MLKHFLTVLILFLYPVLYLVQKTIKQGLTLENLILFVFVFIIIVVSARVLYLNDWIDRLEKRIEKLENKEKDEE